MDSLFPESPLVQTCAKCGFPKTTTEFHRNNDWCRLCIKKAGDAAPLGKKFCTLCKDYFLLADMSASMVYGKLRVSSWCKGCTRKCNRLANKKNYNFTKRRDASLQMNHGITLAEYEAMLEAQGGVCASCKCEEVFISPHTKRLYALSVDHNHQTGKVRGLLCNSCNIALGLLREDPERILALLSYLEQYS